jgi:hypothetical protein
MCKQTMHNTPLYAGRTCLARLFGSDRHPEAPLCYVTSSSSSADTSLAIVYRDSTLDRLSTPLHLHSYTILKGTSKDGYRDDWTPIRYV